MPEAKPIKYYAPLSFGRINEGILRSAYPTRRTFPFVDTLQIKTFVCLCPNELKDELREYARSRDIKILSYDIKFNQDPFLSMDDQQMNEAVSALLDKSNYPILIFCLNGKVKTSSVIGCYRKECKWSMTGIQQEFELFAEPEGNLCDICYIERFQYRYNNLINSSSDDTS